MILKLFAGLTPVIWYAGYWSLADPQYPAYSLLFAICVIQPGNAYHWP